MTRSQMRIAFMLVLMISSSACSSPATPPTATPGNGSQATAAMQATGEALATQPAAQPTTEAPAVASAAPTTAPTTAPTVASTVAPLDTPAWFSKAVLYEVFVRSFYDSDGNGIGDLKGLIQKLDYLNDGKPETHADLGVDVLWLTPIFTAGSYHGYDTIDYEKVSPDYGTNEDLVALVHEAHKRGMRILLDYVANHVSDRHPFLKDAFKNPNSKYSQWFLWQNEEHSSYVSFAGVKSMPQLNLANPETRDYLLGVAKHWLDPNGDGNTEDGVDGYRCDYALGPSHEFWQALRQTVKGIRPDALLLGEVWQNDVSALTPYFGKPGGPGEFDALFDFPLRNVLSGNHDAVNTGVINGKPLPGLIAATLQDEAKRFPPGAELVRFLSNHDTNRVASNVMTDTAKLRLSAMALMTLPGTSMVYYGEEIGMLGKKGPGPIYDEYRREPMEWYAAGKGQGQATWFQDPRQYDRPNDGISVEEEDGKADSLLNQYRKLIALRQSDPALLSGAYGRLDLTDCSSCAGFWRVAGDERVLVAYNFSDKPATATLQLSGETAPKASAPQDLLTGQPSTALNGNTLSLAPWGAVVLQW